LIKIGNLISVNSIFICSIIIFLLYKIIHSAIVIEIDIYAKAITFKKILTKKIEIYSFDDFDGYINTVIMGRQHTFDVLYLIKNKRAVKKIKGFYYSNFDQLREALEPIKYFGFQNNSADLKYKVLFNKPIVA